MYRQATFIVVVVLALVVALFISFVVHAVIEWRRKFSRVKEIYGAILHNIKHPRYTNTQWPTLIDHVKSSYSSFLKAPLVVRDALSLANESVPLMLSSVVGVPSTSAVGVRLALSAVMSAYNVTGGLDSGLPSDVTLIRRIGRAGCYFTAMNLHIIAFRGTATKRDITVDLDFSQCTYKGQYTPVDVDGGLVHTGFYYWWQTHFVDLKSVIDMIPRDANILVCGHSMGAALAAYTAIDVVHSGRSQVQCCIFGRPHFGDDAHVTQLISCIPSCISVENIRDIVRDLPPPVAPTFTQSYIYDNVPTTNVLQLDFEAGSFIDNHHLNSYAEALDATDRLPRSWRWNRPPRYPSIITI